MVSVEVPGTAWVLGMKTSGVVVGDSGVGGTAVGVFGSGVTVAGRLVGEAARGTAVCVAGDEYWQATSAAASRIKNNRGLMVFMDMVLSQCNAYDDDGVIRVPYCL